MVTNILSYGLVRGVPRKVHGGRGGDQILVCLLAEIQQSEAVEFGQHGANDKRGTN